MSDLSRQSSPKSSPRGARSPAHTRQDSTGTLKTTITLGKKPSVFQGGTFYLMTDPPGYIFTFYIQKKLSYKTFNSFEIEFIHFFKKISN